MKNGMDPSSTAPCRIWCQTCPRISRHVSTMVRSGTTHEGSDRSTEQPRW
jgi:hypothetical protein